MRASVTIVARGDAGAGRAVRWAMRRRILQCGAGEAVVTAGDRAGGGRVVTAGRGSRWRTQRRESGVEGRGSRAVQGGGGRSTKARGAWCVVRVVRGGAGRRPSLARGLGLSCSGGRHCVVRRARCGRWWPVLAQALQAIRGGGVRVGRARCLPLQSALRWMRRSRCVQQPP